MNELDPDARLRAAAPASAPDLDPSVVDGAPDRRAPRLVDHGRVVRGASVAFGSLAVATAVTIGVATSIPTAPSGPLFAAASGSGAEASTLGADQRMMLWVDYDYLAGDGLSSDAGRGSVYRLQLAGTPESVAQDVADAFGLSGSPQEASYSSADYPSWVVGPEDGSAPSLAVTWSGTGSWWYSDPGAYPEPVCTPVSYTNEDGSTGSYDDCVTPEVPAADSLLPSDDDARAQASALFAETGLDVAAGDIRIWSDATQVTATANLTVDGASTALEWSVTWTALGEIAWASGNTVEVVDSGDFDTVSAVDAVERLEDGRWFGAAGPDYSGGMVAFAADALVREAPAPDGDATEVPSGEPEAPTTDIPTEEPGLEPSPEGEPAPEPEPEVLPEPEVEPAPEPETVTVTLERADATLLLLWDVDGNAWLVPGYAFEQAEDGFWTAVVSLVDGVITLPEPIEVDTLEG